MSISDKEAEVRVEILCRAITLGIAIAQSGLPPDEFTVAALRYQASYAEHMLTLINRFKIEKLTKDKRDKIIEEEYEKCKPLLDFIIKDMGLV